MEIFTLIAEVGAPIAGALVMGVFIFIIIKQIMSNHRCGMDVINYSLYLPCN